MHLGLKAIKNQGKLLYLGRSLVLILIFYFLYQELVKFNWNQMEWRGIYRFAPLIFAVLLVPVNWYFEWRKWMYTSRKLKIDDKNIIQRGFYAGMISGFLTPSALGNFIGRMTEVDKTFRPKVITYTFYSNGAQFITSLLFGVISVYLVTELPLQIIDLNWKPGLVILVILFVAVYYTFPFFPFFRSWFASKIPSIQEVTIYDKSIFLYFSILRYLVFSFQFYLLINAFQAHVDYTLLFAVWHLYLWTTLSPSLVMGKLFVRESMALFVLTKVGVEVPIALLSSLLIWLLNNVLPSLYAYLKWKQNVVAEA